MKLLFPIALSFIALTASAQPAPANWSDLNYAGDTMVCHRLDIYLPETSKTAYPVVLLVYGSAFFGNDLKGHGMEHLGRALLEAGFAVATPNHRSSRDALFPAQIHDIKAAIRFLRANAGTYRLDTAFVGITGYSSGGHLAAMAGTTGNVREFTIGSLRVDLEGNVGHCLPFSSAVDAVVDWFGPTDFLKMDSCGSRMVHNAPDSPESSLIGGPIRDHPERCALANPITYVDAADPPFLIFHGDADPLVPHCQSRLLHEALQLAGVQSHYEEVAGAGHGPGLFEKPYLDRMAAFFLREASKP
jgi:acetyl esterase/lipase